MIAKFYAILLLLLLAVPFVIGLLFGLIYMAYFAGFNYANELTDTVISGLKK